MCNSMHYRLLGEIDYPFPNFNSAAVDVEILSWIGNHISHFSGHVINHPYWEVIKSMLVKWASFRISVNVDHIPIQSSAAA